MQASLAAAGPLVLALLTALAIDRLTARRGLAPPGFSAPEGAGAGARWLSAGRRALAFGVLAGVLWIGVFSPLGHIGDPPEIDPSQLSVAQLFLLHFLFALALGIWYLAGFGPFAGRLRSQLGLRVRGVGRELALGLGVGLVAWFVVLSALVAIGVVIWMVAGEEALAREPPALIPWVAALPVWARIAVSCSAGGVEELFFRGFLQPRVGIALSTGLFVLAHASYEQPLMLVGITLLSLVFAFLVRWRQSIWAAAAAHAAFDAIQLLVVIPRLMEFLGPGEGSPVAPIAALAWRGVAG